MFNIMQTQHLDLLLELSLPHRQQFRDGEPHGSIRYAIMNKRFARNSDHRPILNHVGRKSSRLFRSESLLTENLAREDQAKDNLLTVRASLEYLHHSRFEIVKRIRNRRFGKHLVKTPGRHNSRYTLKMKEIVLDRSR